MTASQSIPRPKIPELITAHRTAVIIEDRAAEAEEAFGRPEDGSLTRRDRTAALLFDALIAEPCCSAADVREKVTYLLCGIPGITDTLAHKIHGSFDEDGPSGNIFDFLQSLRIPTSEDETTSVRSSSRPESA